MSDLTPYENFKTELAKSLGKELVDQVFGFINDIVRPPAKELGGLLADKVKEFRLKTQIKTIRRAMDFQAEIGAVSQLSNRHTLYSVISL
ncbi:MAG: hypothetical protein HYW01_06940 [Deltaproteobacteria bacterium]|nr:hypothetical protein [Deltaproteobacteria bacterium]